MEVLTESLTLKETPIPSKVARLMLVSDVLHNSSAPVKNASAYRTLFEARLPDIMESFNDLYRNITGRITAEALKVITGNADIVGSQALDLFTRVLNASYCFLAIKSDAPLNYTILAQLNDHISPSSIPVLGY